MNPGPTPSIPQAVAPPVTGDSTETTPEAVHDADTTPTTHEAAVTTAHDPTAPSRPPGGTLRFTFKLRLEDTSEVLLDLDDSVDFRHGAYTRSIAIVGDQVRKVFEAIVAEPLLTTVNQYVRLKLDAGQVSARAVEKPDAPSFPQFPSPNATPDGHPLCGPADH